MNAARVEGRGGVLIARTEQLSHFAAHSECLTCFSASMCDVSQGDTEGSDLHVIDEEQELFSTDLNVLLDIHVEQLLR